MNPGNISKRSHIVHLSWWTYFLRSSFLTVCQIIPSIFPQVIDWEYIGGGNTAAYIPRNIWDSFATTHTELANIWSVCGVQPHNTPGAVLAERQEIMKLLKEVCIFSSRPRLVVLTGILQSSSALLKWQKRAEGNSLYQRETIRDRRKEQ